ncbi:MAG: S28 family serine protease [Bacteroides sp.]
MKKVFRSFFFALLLSCCISSVTFAQSVLQQKMKALPTVTAIEEVKSEAFSEKYVVRFTQPLDHKHPEKGSFTQRVIVFHAGFDRPTVLVTEGYQASYALHPRYREELSKLFDANMVFVEYRYFDQSTPEPKDWQYLTAEASADDLHAVRQAFSTIYPGKWIATGISKGGQTTLLYRTFYPDDVDVSVPYVAPLCFDREDGRHEPFLRKVSTDADRQRILEYQLEVLKRKTTLLPKFEQYCKEKNYLFRAPTAEIFDFCVLEYSFALWQWGTPISTIPASNSSDEALFKHLMEISEPGYFDLQTSTASFFVQAARELGYYGYDTRPFKKYLTIKSSKDYLRRLMLPEELREMPFDKRLSRRIKKFLKKEDPKMIFIYGQNDPWTAAGVTWLKGKKNIHVFIQPGGSHLARINTLTEEQQQEAKQLLKQWMEE